MRVLITAGGTREAIDGVRFVTNASTGKTGAFLADFFAESGGDVTLLRASSALPATDTSVKTDTFVSVADLDRACREILGAEEFTLVIHAAAVSDFVVSGVTVDGSFYPAPLSGKLDSAKKLSVELTPGPKILPKLKTYSKNPNLVLVGFKLTDGATDSGVQTAVKRVLSGGADFVVHNEVKDVAGQTDRRASLWDAAGRVQIAPDEAALARLLLRAGG